MPKQQSPANRKNIVFGVRLLGLCFIAYGLVAANSFSFLYLIAGAGFTFIQPWARTLGLLLAIFQAAIAGASLLGVTGANWLSDVNLRPWLAGSATATHAFNAIAGVSIIYALTRPAVEDLLERQGRRRG